jgi:hypothetical protein
VECPSCGAVTSLRYNGVGTIRLLIAAMQAIEERPG